MGSENIEGRAAGGQVSKKEHNERVVGLIAELPDEERLRFRKELMECLNYETWCEDNGIKISDPNVVLAKVRLYEELYIDKSRELP